MATKADAEKRLEAAQAAERAAQDALEADALEKQAEALEAKLTKTVKKEGAAPVSLEAAVHAALDRAEAAEQKADRALTEAKRLRKEAGLTGAPVKPDGNPAPVPGSPEQPAKPTLGARFWAWLKEEDADDYPPTPKPDGAAA